ncbi:MAG: hypothetical protein ACXWNK_15240 [Vulcanimicrobiaceae bacterium]
MLAHASIQRFDFQAEQWWGNDGNADGFGSVQGSSGGYARMKYYVTPHAYVGIRYDASANPFLSRDMVYYVAFHITPHARLLFQQAQPVLGTGQFQAAMTIGLPWPAHL